MESCLFAKSPSLVPTGGKQKADHSEVNNVRGWPRRNEAGEREEPSLEGPRKPCKGG